MKKILHIQLMPILSGAQKVCLDEMENLGPDYEQWLLCSAEGLFTQRAEKLGVKIVIVTKLMRNISLKNDILALLEVYRIIKKGQFDIVHTHSSKTGFIGRLAAKLAGVKKVIHTVHGFAFPSTKNIFTKLIYYFMEVIAALCTDALILMNKNDYTLAKKCLPIKNKKLHLLNNGVDTNKFKRKTYDDSKTNIIKIVMVGRLCEQKNPELLLEAFSKLGNQFELYFIGDGPLRNHLEKNILTKKISERVTLCGWIENATEKLEAFDLFILPSRWEGMPLALLEAMASGLPVITSDIPANKFLIDNTNGLLFRDNDVNDLKNKIIELAENSEKRKHISEDAYNKVHANFSLTSRIKYLKEIYEQK